jgi:hypothetical protein
MEDSYNNDESSRETTKTSSTDGRSSGKTTGDSQVQEGIGVENQEQKPYEKSDEQQEYIDQANSNTEAGNENPVQDGKSMTMMVNIGSDNDDDIDEEDENDDPLRETEIGDDQEDTLRKMPVM